MATNNDTVYKNQSTWVENKITRQFCHSRHEHTSMHSEVEKFDLCDDGILKRFKFSCKIVFVWSECKENVKKLNCIENRVKKVLKVWRSGGWRE
jgi:hypothetical protein